MGSSGRIGNLLVNYRRVLSLILLNNHYHYYFALYIAENVRSYIKVYRLNTVLYFKCVLSQNVTLPYYTF